MGTTLQVADPGPTSAPTLIVLGRRERLRAPSVRAAVPAAALELWDRMLEDCPAGDGGGSVSTFFATGSVRRLFLGVLPEPCSRHNSPARPHAITHLLKKDCPPRGDVDILLALNEPEHAFASALAVARSFHELHRRKDPAPDRTVRVQLLSDAGPIPAARLQAAIDAVRLVGRLVDTPPDDLHTDAFVDEALRAVEGLAGVSTTLIRGEELRQKGFGGLFGVGRAAEHGPALLALHWNPPGATRSVAWVGKGIVYDTGGLSLKTKEGMPGMKGDMAGAACVLATFIAAVRLRCPFKLHAVLCLAENALSSASIRPDDVLTMFSGRTVEVNNTDAEGRLVLADGVAWAARTLEPEIIVDLATLTGAQLVATGKRHAGIVTNDEQLEALCVRAGRSSGDLCHPLPFVPEFFRKEFKSEVADMKNSVKDRNNAQSSCAAQFIAEHLPPWKGQWLHVDMAGPSDSAERGTGFGVGLLLDLFGVGR